MMLAVLGYLPLVVTCIAVFGTVHDQFGPSPGAGTLWLGAGLSALMHFFAWALAVQVRARPAVPYARRLAVAAMIVAGVGLMLALGQGVVGEACNVFTNAGTPPMTI